MLHIAWNLRLLCNPPLCDRGGKGEEGEREWTKGERSRGLTEQSGRDQGGFGAQGALRKYVVELPSRGTSSSVHQMVSGS